MATRSKVDVVIVGAGAAGIGAARTLSSLGVTYAMLEASHRTGGRGYTEETAPGEPFDLGCHWLHSGSINPMVKFADEFGLRYTQESYGSATFCDGAWQSESVVAQLDAFSASTYEVMQERSAENHDVSVYDCVDRDNKWASVFDYWISLETSADSDQVSMLDLARYNDTQENWPLRDGYGALLTKLGENIAVELNCAVERISWGERGTRVSTVKGELESEATIVTVSNGVLGAQDIVFNPLLPDWKLEAIASVPLGNHNRICLSFKRNLFGDTAENGMMYIGDGDEIMSFRVRPFGFNQVIGVTGGRFGSWMERAGAETAANFALDGLAAIYGNDVKHDFDRHKVTAWESDPWVKGAYSAALPGCHHQRERLREPLGERLHFAGEATSPAFYTTAHGAYLSGVSAANTVAGSLALTNSAKPTS